MRKVNFLFLFISIFIGIVSANVMAIQSGKEEQILQFVKEEHVPDELLVKFKEGVSEEDIIKINKRFGTQVVNVLDEERRLYQLKISPSSKVEEVVKEYRALPEVEYVEFNYIVGIE